MQLTEKQAIKECKELWNEIEESGLSKWDFLQTVQGKKWADRLYEGNCSLCEYTVQRSPQIGERKCHFCPLPSTGDKRCFTLGYYYNERAKQSWFDVIKSL